jgi:hypothetical protein
LVKVANFGIRIAFGTVNSNAEKDLKSTPKQNKKDIEHKKGHRTKNKTRNTFSYIHSAGPADQRHPLNVKARGFCWSWLFDVHFFEWGPDSSCAKFETSLAGRNQVMLNTGSLAHSP